MDTRTPTRPGRKRGPKPRPGSRIHVSILLTRDQRAAVQAARGPLSLARWIETLVVERLASDAATR